MKNLPVQIIFCSFLYCFCPIKSFCQNVQNSSSGSKNSFSYQINSTYGVSTSANATPNLTVDTEAILKLAPGSMVTNKFGDSRGNTSAVFTASPNGGGGSVDIKGLVGENKFMIDSGTTFRSALKTREGSDPSQSSIGNASATASHTSTVTVEKASSSFSNTFNQSF